MRQREPIEFDVSYLFSFLFFDVVARMRQFVVLFLFVKASLRIQTRQ